MPDSDMLLVLSAVLETPVSTLLGETIAPAEPDGLKAISEKLEVINLQLAGRKAARRKILHGTLLGLCAALLAIFVLLSAVLKSPYLNWDYSSPETAVIGVTLHACEWIFVRAAPVLLLGAAIGAFLTRKKD